MNSYKLRDLEIKPGLVLSPMSGVTTSAFRRLIKELNPGAVGLVVTEFISVEAMTRQVQRSLDMMRFAEMERPFAVQIFGFDIKRMCDAAKMVEDAGADVVDINCGCPAPKVVRKGGGCELMRQPEHLGEMLREVRKAVKIPLTLKIRSGWDSNSINALEIAAMAEDAGIEALAIHGRTRAQLYRGDADWNIVNMAAAKLKIPVLGSGDVTGHMSARERFAGRVSGLLIGRASMYNPYVFSDIMSGKETKLRHEPELVFKALERYCELLLEQFPPQGCIGKVKQLASQMCRGYTWRKELLTAATLDKQIEIIKRARESGGDFSRPAVRDEYLTPTASAV